MPAFVASLHGCCSLSAKGFADVYCVLQIVVTAFIVGMSPTSYLVLSHYVVLHTIRFLTLSFLANPRFADSFDACKTYTRV